MVPGAALLVAWGSRQQLAPETHPGPLASRPWAPCGAALRVWGRHSRTAGNHAGTWA
jgi:hypothetical protein